MGQDMAPLHATAIILPLLAFPAWILCVPPLCWHYSQRNIAALSLVLWLLIGNFFNSVNPLIWPRDNVQEWYDGHVFCDIQVRFWVGYSVAPAACTAMIFKRLSLVLDTRKITVAPDYRSLVRGRVFEILWCWGYPIIMILLYHVVQPIRYFIFGITGCTESFDASWPSIVLNFIWPSITMCFAAFYAAVLIYRLWHYRRDFHRLVAARDTTKARFMRLFVMAMIILVIFLPLNFFILYYNSAQVTERYSWDRVHGTMRYAIVKVPVNGYVRWHKWIQVLVGYLAFVLFGIGNDAKNTYKQALCALGLGKLFPSLYSRSGSESSTPSNFDAARSWASRAKSLFTNSTSATDTLPNTTRSDSLSVATNHPMPKENPSGTTDTKIRRSFLDRLFARRNRQVMPVLPFSADIRRDVVTKAENSPADSCPPDAFSHAWALNDSTSSRDAHIAAIRPNHGSHSRHDQDSPVKTSPEDFV